MAQQRDDIDELEGSFKQLKILYEKYFAGVDRLPPTKQHDALKTLARRVSGGGPVNNTARRFRLQTLQASLVSHEQYWTKVCRQIEEGTYKRDRARARKLLDALEPKAPVSSTRDEKRADAAAESPKYPPAVQKLYDAYVMTEASLGNTTRVTIDAIAATVRKQATAVKEQYKCKTVEFKVVVKDGKAVLQAIPK